MQQRAGKTSSSSSSSQTLAETAPASSSSSSSSSSSGGAMKGGNPHDHHHHHHEGHHAIRERLRLSWPRGLALLGVLAPFALLEGAAFERSRVLWPRAIHSAFLFENWIVMKVFLSAIGSSMLVQAVLHVYDEHLFDRSRFYKHAHFGLLKRVVPGTLILGAGMALAGTGSTMLPPQVGASATGALSTLAGMIIGAASFALAEQRLFGSEKLHCPRESHHKTTVEDHLGWDEKRYHLFAAAAGTALLGAAWALELPFPNAADCAHLGVAVGWFPQLAGMAIGLGQAPIRIISGDGAGGATSIMNALSTLTGGYLSERHFIRRPEDIFQLSYNWLGLLGGAAFMAYSFREDGLAQGFPAAQGIVGGALALFGSRVAGGCTCGHGISGTSELSVQSFVGAAAMFAGGISAAFAMRWSGFDYLTSSWS